ncbi:MAG: aminodeoxychorismate/anthranilate synthase component II [bacterium]|jgi:anthranilate synthase/aminodeoxychorismate synthase-like glutamine amidotransferase|nr:aminodeoxychorismate/anthranilate synthase component II [bacterium]MBK7188353.1 aminodeoxychorismate/anthranilate synthase component II [bacterium]MBK7669779.1 aminodeoxychorismate/anthranilate synthase component II [bacterium]MBK7770109.1 aminodeoxychorismate/anthranilate synthase component II [bacterium]MBK9471530.1 aminodeoxychorismate/anthranilate synthase component II [bacterium]
MILLIDNYDSFTWNLVQAFGSQGAEVRVERNDAITVEQALALAPAALVVSPGPGGPRDAGVSLAMISAFTGRVPILGVCLGHQCIVEAAGGSVIRAARPVHGKTSRIYHDGAGIYAGLSNPFEATRYHSLIAAEGDLPASLRVTSYTSDGEIMGVRHTQHLVEGVQFHPESILTLEGRLLLANFLGAVRAAGGRHGQPA